MIDRVEESILKREGHPVALRSSGLAATPWSYRRKMRKADRVAFKAPRDGNWNDQLSYLPLAAGALG